MGKTKDKYQQALANLPVPVVLLNQERLPEFLNHAARDFLAQISPSAGSSELPIWLTTEIDDFASSPLSEKGLERKLEIPEGHAYFQVNLRKTDEGIILTASDMSNIRFAEECLREMVHGLSEATGEAFFQFLVQHLAKAIGADYAFICEFCEQNRAWVKTVAVCADGALLENFTFELANTPCNMVVNTRSQCCYPRGVQNNFPLDHLAIELDVESYVGVPLIDSGGNVLGTLAVFGRRPLRNRQLAESMLQIFAARATAELERKQAEEDLRETKGRLKTIVDSVQTGIILIEAESRRIIDANDVAANMIGTSKYRLVGTTCHKHVCPYESGRCPVIDREQTIENCEDLLLTAEGIKLPVIKNVASVMLNGRKHLLESFIDISDRKQAEIEIQALAYYDTLTGLPNRTFLQDRLGRTLIGRPGSRPFAVMFLDLDRFKDINDTLGHVFGDGMLKEVAARLIGCVRKNDTVLRLGGDEFVVVLPGVNKERDIANVARKILNVLGEPILIDEHEIFTTGSIGIALYPADGKDMDTLLKHADTAMYRAKDQGRNNFQFFSREMNLQAVEQRQLETSLRHAVNEGELFLVYQPQIELRTGRLVGVEALLRWRHPELGILLPRTFVGLAEKTGLIIPLGEFVLRAACRQGLSWHEAGYHLRIAVNLSAR
ncbi:MAG: diguanylate cyclase, partial [Deltaproteobacteria bacterium]